MDPVRGQPKVPQSWNRYAYVLNRPMVATDPTGQTLVGALIYLAQSASKFVPNDSSETDLSGFFEFLGFSKANREGVREIIEFLQVLNQAMPGAQMRWQADIQAEQGDLFGYFVFSTMADLNSESTGGMALAAAPGPFDEAGLLAGRALTKNFKYAVRKLGLDAKNASEAKDAIGHRADVLFDIDTGDILAPESGEIFGNLFDAY